MSMHDEALSRLCFVCGEIMNGTFYDVEKNLKLLRSGLRSPDFSPIPGETPLNYCKKCDFVLRTFVSGKSVQTGRKLLDWKACGPDCGTCKNIAERKSKRGRRQKVIIF